MIINFGSINIDHVYRVARLPAPGETTPTLRLDRFLGGKGINQSIAIARSGGAVRHVGNVGPDGAWVLDQIASAGVALDHIGECGQATGHAVVAVAEDGENAILIHAGANHGFSAGQISGALTGLPPGPHWVLLQNETNLAGEIVREARATGCIIAYSAAPFVAEVTLEILEAGIDLLVVNAGELAQLLEAAQRPVEDLPVKAVLVTEGSKGARLIRAGEITEQPAFTVEATDTAGAGDTFLGAFLARYVDGDAAGALHYAAAASAIQVTRPGAAPAIPTRAEVDAFLAGRQEG